MSTVVANVWLLYCVDEAKNVEWIKRPSESDPTTCPNNHTHIINNIRVVDTICENITEIKQERTQTNQSYTAITIDDLIASPNSEYVVEKTRDFGGTILECLVRTKDIHEGDQIEISSNPDQIIGVTTTTYTAPPNYDAATSYSVNDLCLYSGFIGSSSKQIYKCLIAHTNILPVSVSSAYWLRMPFVMNVSSPVLSKIINGWRIKITNGVTLDDLRLIASIDQTASTITMACAPLNSYAAGSYLKLTALFAYNFTFGPAGEYPFGRKNNINPYAPAGTRMTIKYKNNSLTGDPKKLHMEIHYLH
jgi:hypothetical protein